MFGGFGSFAGNVEHNNKGASQCDCGRFWLANFMSFAVQGNRLNLVNVGVHIALIRDSRLPKPCTHACDPFTGMIVWHIQAQEDFKPPEFAAANSSINKTYISQMFRSVTTSTSVLVCTG